MKGPQPSIIYHRKNDKELIMRIINHNDMQALNYLFYERYDYNLRYLAYRYCHTLNYYEDMIAELCLKLLGSNGDWKPLKNFQWRSSFKTYLCKIASNCFDEFRKKNIEIKDFAPQNTQNSTDANGNTVYAINGKISKQSSLSLDERKIVLLEAIRRMDNEEHKLIMTKMLEGYKPREIADMLNLARERKGITRIYKNKEVIITAKYIHMMKPKVIATVKTIIKQIEKEWYERKR